MMDATRIRAVILTTQRTGSTFLVQCLGSHPQIECASEILIGDPDVLAPPKHRGRFKELAKLANIARSGAWRPGNRMYRFFTEGQAKVRVFKVMYNQLANPFAIHFLRQNKDIRILHLRRYNLLKVHVSRLLMSKRDHVQATTPVEAVRIQVDPVRALVGMRSAQLRYERFEALFEGHMRLPLTYEDLIDGQFLQAVTGRRICDFLEVQHLPMKSRLMKLNPESLRDMVINYDELASAVSRSQFAGMLE